MTPSDKSAVDWPRAEPTLLDKAVGKTIASTEAGRADGTDEYITFHFTDGSSLRLRSWDYEGYSSGIYLTEPE